MNDTGVLLTPHREGGLRNAQVVIRNPKREGGLGGSRELWEHQALPRKRRAERIKGMRKKERLVGREWGEGSREGRREERRRGRESTAMIKTLSAG